MPVEAKPLFRPDVLRPHLAMFDLPGHVEAALPKLEHWAVLLRSSKADAFNRLLKNSGFDPARGRASGTRFSAQH